MRSARRLRDQNKKLESRKMDLKGGPYFCAAVADSRERGGRRADPS